MSQYYSLNSNNSAGFSYIEEVLTPSPLEIPNQSACSIIKNHFDGTDMEGNTNFFSKQSYEKTKEVLHKNKDRKCNLKSEMISKGNEVSKTEIHDYITQLNNLNDNSLFLLSFITLGLIYLIIFNKFFNYKTLN